MWKVLIFYKNYATPVSFKLDTVDPGIAKIVTDFALRQSSQGALAMTHMSDYAVM